MKADFSRVSFRRDRHFSSVRMQQGVVQLDADANEQTDIGLHRDETTAADVVGPNGAPIGPDAGFELVVAGNTINIGKGRMYVHGTLCENDSTVAYEAQPDLVDPILPTDPGRYLFYLDVWQRHITSLEEPDIHEVALGEAQTATRTKTVWQVRWTPVEAAAECPDFGATWAPPGQSTGRLRARESPAQDLTDNCLVPPGAGFRRLENQLYRVEIHQPTGAPGGPTFKWSRDNGSVTGALESIEGNELKISEPRRDAERGISGATWVELTDDKRVLKGEPGELVEVVPEDDVLTVMSWPAGPLTLDQFEGHPLVRRWDSKGPVKVTTGKFIELEDGVEIEFAPGDYRSGDYWLIPARSLTGRVLWPRTGTIPQFEDAHGIEHRYCPLALLDLAGPTWTRHSDCRNLFPPLTEMVNLFYLGGDGQEAMPDVAQPGALIPLGLPLEVGVSRGKWPVQGAAVRFEVKTGKGALGCPSPVLTDQNGVASCTWSVDPTTPIQEVTALLVDDKGAPMHLPIHFGANLSTATRVSYDPKACEGLANAFTVQDAIDRVSQIARLYYVAGDNQQGLPESQLDPLRVVAANDCGPLAKVVVRFEVTRGDGSVNGVGQVDVPTDGNGEAECEFVLGDEHRQEVVARILSGASVVGTPSSVTFSALTSVADEVGYDPSRCDVAAGARTVQEALDALCRKAPTGDDPGLHVREVLIGDEPLRNDSKVSTQQLAKGITAICDDEIDPASIDDKPTCFVTLNLPWPFDQSARDTWGDELIGGMPLVLNATARAEGERILWLPTNESRDWLVKRLDGLFSDLLVPSVLAWFTLKGNFIWIPGEKIHLDGDVFGVPEGERTELELPSGDGHRGGDFEMWFHVTPS